MIYGFNELSVAERLKQIGGESSFIPGTESEQGNGWILKTPAGGIPKRNGTTCGSADCTVQRVDKDGEIVDFTDAEGNTVSVKVYNIFQADIGGDAYITAKNVAFEQIVDAEDCPPDASMTYQGDWVQP